MIGNTVHVYRTAAAWAIKREGGQPETFQTLHDAIKAARENARITNGQLVVHGPDGRITDHETFGMTAVQDPPRKSRLAKKIGHAVGKVALERVKADPLPPRDYSR